ncbi:TonB-dependent receptor [Sphingobium rhizovicinum]|uniref:TonB-dependent receptor n=1 Tax=Sphingobium rhizovicinum TaxID=432308 RepID=A0ABV7NMY0_9SPHN
MSGSVRDLCINGARKAALLASVATLVGLTGTAAQAQEAQSENYQLQDIVVTAQKRSQNVQDTPLSVTAVSGEALVSQGITSVQELNRIDPALQIGQATGTVTTFIRGIGNPVTTAGNEASVPVYIDDVYFIRAGFPFFDLASVDRVEVLKGPQGTLFGRNASGGVISIYTKDPSQDAELEARMGYANYETMDLKFYGNMPITDRLAANFSMSWHNQDQGWGRNKKLVDQLDTSKGYQDGGNDYWKGHSISLRGKLLWEPTDTTAVKLIGYYQNSWSQIGIYSRPFPGTVGGSPDPAHNGAGPIPEAPVPSQVLPALDFYDVSLAEEQYDASEGWGVSARIDQELGFADFVSITAYRHNKELYHSSGNYSDYDWLVYDLNIVDKQFSQEFQLKSAAGSKINWILGAYYLNADGGFDPTYIGGPGQNANGIDVIKIVGRQKVKSYAGFGQVTVPLGEMTNVTGGLRYTVDKVRGTGYTDVTFFPGIFGPDPFVLRAQQFDAHNDFGNPNGISIIDGDNPSASKTFKKWTYKISGDHKFNDDVMAYASYSRGYKAGTFNTLPLDTKSLNPEIVDAYEIGLKTELFDRKVRFNTALFWNDISNPQIQAQRNGLVFLANAGSARTKGAEFDLTTVVAQGLTLRLGGTYLDAKFRNFGDVDGNGTLDCASYVPSPTAPGNLDQISINCSGNRMPYASKWKFSGGASYVREIEGAGEMTLDLTGNWSSSFNWDADNLIKEPSRFLLDGAVGFTPERWEHLTLRFWMKNITGKKYNINYYAQASGSAFASAPGAPRTYGGELVFKF